MYSDLFDAGPPLRLERWVGLVTTYDRRIARRALGITLIGWAPLLILNLWHQVFEGDGALWSFLHDFGANARFLVAAPLLIIAEAQCLPLLSRIPLHFLHSGIIVGEDRQKFQQQLASTARLLNSIWAEVLTVVFAYGIVLASTSVLRSAYAPKWQIQQTADGFQYTAAGWWHAFISLPVLMFLIFGWLWRQFLWGGLLWRISKLKLRLIAAHPDRVGGLRFLATTVQGYWPLSLAFASIVAGRVANQVREGSTLKDSRFVIGALLVFVLGFCLLPSCAFARRLRSLKRHGTFEYGTLGRAVGEQFEERWLNKASRVTVESLEAPDFSATTDAYSIVGNVHGISYFPVDFGSIRELIIVTLMPFVPIVLAAVPFEALIADIRKLLV